MALATQFLSQIRSFVIEHNGAELARYLQVEQTANQIYFNLGNELRTGLPPSNDAIEKLVDRCLPIDDEVQEGRGSPWPGFNAFIKEYLEFWRDVNFQNIPLHHRLLSSLVT
jgi:nuclear mRNA export protein PCID2/THP1